MGELRLPVGANELLQYFEGVNREYSGAHWRNGIAMCRKWLDLDARKDLVQEDIDQFVARLNAERNCGSGWPDMRMQFIAWALRRGFRA
jgi:hypothetical protein